MNLSLLIAECMQRSIAAQHEFTRIYTKQIFLLCKRYVKHDELAMEMTMNTLLKFFSELPNRKESNEAKTMGWLQKIAVNECLMHLRTTRNFLLITSDALPEVSMDEDITSRLGVKEIFSFIAKLPANYRTVFNLYVMEERSHAEIAQLLGINERNSYAILKRARKRLIQMITQNDKDYEIR